MITYLSATPLRSASIWKDDGTKTWHIFDLSSYQDDPDERDALCGAVLDESYPTFYDYIEVSDPRLCINCASRAAEV